MNITHQDVVLDVNYNKSNVIVNAHQGDTGTRFIDVTLTQSGEVITMSDTFTATAKASIYGAVKAVNECEVDTVNNKIIVELTNTMLDTPGKLICEITLSEGEQIITTQMFTVNVSQSVLNGGTEIVRNTELEKLLKVISLVAELSTLESLEDLREKATTAYNRVVQYTKTAVDLNSTSITDTPVVNLSGCTVDNAPVTGAISGTVVNFNYKVDLESFIVQFLIMRNNYTYKRSYGSSGWSSWGLVADDLSQYLKTEDLQGAILSDIPSDTTAYSSNKVNALLKEKIDTVAIRGADMTTTPTLTTNIQKEGSTLAIYSTKLFSDTPSDTTTYSGNKINALLNEKIDTVNTNLSQLSEEINSLKENGTNTGSGVTTAQANSLWAVLQKTAFVETLSDEELTAFKTAWGLVETEEGVTSISATYSGGDVAVGTAVSALTGIVVTAHYSDGTSATVTGYTLSGTIAEGSNTITVSYGGKMATFTVTGVAESGGEETGVSNETEWADGVAYTFDWIDGEFVRQNGEIKAYSGWSRTPYLYCAGASQIEFIYPNSQMSDYNAFYDANKVYISSFSPNSQNPVNVPSTAVYVMFSGPTDVVDGNLKFRAIPRGVTP